MVQLNSNNNINLSKLPIATLPFNINLLNWSISALAQFKNISALKRLLGIRMTADEIVVELRDPRTVTHKYLSEIVMSILEFLFGEQKFQAAQKAAEDAERHIYEGIEDEWELEQRTQAILEIISQMNIKEANDRLKFIEESGFITAAQRVQALKINELCYWLAKAPDEKTRKVVFEAINQVFEYRAQGLKVLEKIEHEIKDPKTPPTRRAALEDKRDAMNMHYRNATPERMERIVPHVYKDAEKIGVAARNCAALEELVTRIGVEVLDPKQNKQSLDNANPNKWENVSLEKSLSDCLHDIRTMYPNVLDNQNDIMISQIILLLHQQSHKCDPGTEKIIGKLVETVLFSLPEDQKFSQIKKLLKENFYGKSDFQKLKKGDSQKECEIFKENTVSISQAEKNLCEQIISILDSQINQLDIATEELNLANDIKETVNKIKSEISERDFNNQVDRIINLFNILTEKPRRVDVSQLKADLTKLSFIEENKLRSTSLEEDSAYALGI